MLTTFTSKFQERFNSLSFKTKALSVAALLSTLPVLGIGTLAYVVAHDGLQTSETQQQQYIAESFRGNLVRFLILRQQDIESLALTPALVDPKLKTLSTVAGVESYLDRFGETNNFYDSIAVLDLQGNPLYVSKGGDRSNVGDRPYFQATLKSGKSQVTPAEIVNSSGKAVFYVTAPIRDASTGQVLGAVVARMPVESLKVLTNGFAKGNNTNSWLIADRRSNRFLLAKEANQIGRMGNDFASFDRLKNTDKVTTVTDANQLIGKNQLVSYITIPQSGSLPDLGLSVLITNNADAIFAKEQGLLSVIALGMLVSAGVTLALALLLSNRVTQFIKNMAETIARSSGAIVDTVEMQEVTVNMQANSAIETSTTVNELGESSFQSAEQAEASATGARQALSLAEDGTRAVQQTLQGMTGLREKVDAIANQIVNLGEQTGQITVVSELVADLASQTNMLALNAAVEAARAGEQGRGFSVVAGEIRKLADQSKKSADKINALAEDIQVAINKTVMVTDEGTKTVNEGIVLAQSTAATFAGVTDAINNVFLNSQQISTSAKQQAVSIQQVLSSITNISQGSQESAVGMHQVKMTTKELTQVADELKAAVV